MEPVKDFSLSPQAVVKQRVGYPISTELQEALWLQCWEETRRNKTGLGAILATSFVIQMRDDEGLDQGGGSGDRGGQVQEQVKSVGIRDLQGNGTESHFILFFLLFSL